MTLTVIVGGQYGSEGKGKMASYLAKTAGRGVYSVRSGGSNAGHTAYRDDTPHRLRQLPSGAVVPHTPLRIAAGAVVDLPVLRREVHDLAIDLRRLMIDRNAVVMEDADSAAETLQGLRERVGSTLSGTGVATTRKIMRAEGLHLAQHEPSLRHVVGRVSEDLNWALDRGEHVVIEGTQGFGLSLHHSEHYPFVTSRDTTAAAFLSDVGLSPLLVTDVILVLRTFPIRVAGNSGPLNEETTWQQIAAYSSANPITLGEYTTVTQQLRRVGMFDWDLAGRAIRANRPTVIALHGADYLDRADYGVSDWSDLSTRSTEFVRRIEAAFDVPVGYVFTGPEDRHIVDRIRTSGIV